jgi:hypothetical protein
MDWLHWFNKLVTDNINYILAVCIVIIFLMILSYAL